MRPDIGLARRIRQARLDSGLTLAQACGTRLTISHLSRIERGSRGITADRLVYLAERLGKDVGHLLGEGASADYLDALLQEGRNREAAGQHTLAVALFQSLLPSIPRDDHARLSSCHAGVGFSLVRLGQHHLAKFHVDRSLQLAELASDAHLLAYARNAAGVYHLSLNEHAVALMEFERGLSALQKHSSPRPHYVTVLLLNKGHTLRLVGRLDEAVLCLSQARGLAEQESGTITLGLIARNAASVLMDMGAHAEARQRLEEARECYVSAERPDLVAQVENGLGILLLETGQFEEAIPHLWRAVYLCERIANDQRRALSLTELGRAYILLEQYDRALPHVLEAVRLAIKVGDDVEAARAEALRGEILAARGRFHEAEAAFASAIPILDHKGLKQDRIRAYAAFGNACREAGWHLKASEALARAVALAGRPVWNFAAVQ